MYMVRHDLHTFNDHPNFIGFFLEELLCSLIHSVYQYFSSIFRTKYYMITYIEY